MNHRRDAHGKSKRKCRHKDDNTCKFGPEECWYDHSDTVVQEKSSGVENELKCKTCSQMFISKSQLLKHRKQQHEETVPICRMFREGNLVGSKKINAGTFISLLFRSMCPYKEWTLKNNYFKKNVQQKVHLKSH